MSEYNNMGIKVLIATMHRGSNFGSALQVYALSQSIKKCKAIPIVLDYIPNRIKFSKVLGETLKKMFSLSSSLQQRYQAFRGLCLLLSNTFYYGRFFRRELSMTKSYYSIEEIEKANLYTDVYMTGSDQVWNSTHNQGIDRVFFLDFLPKEAKRVAYAASFGKTELEEWEKDITQTLLSRYSAISVRESSALKILESIDIHNGVNVLDPTLLLNKDEWSRRCPKLKEEPYLLIYSVEPEKQQIIQIAREIAASLNLKVYMVEWGVKAHAGVDKMVCNIDPLKLMSYFLHADYVVASSFHGTAFSVNLNKPFISVAPKCFNTRAQSLLNLVGLSERLVTFDSFSLDSALATIDYTSVNEILESERTKSMKYLKSIVE